MADKKKGFIESRITFDDVQVVDVTVCGEDGAKISKRITLNEYINILSSQNEEWQELPRLPIGTIKTKWMDAKNYKIAIFVEKDVRPTIFLKNERPLMVPYPNLIFTFEFRDGAMRSSTCFAVKEEFAGITDETELYFFPYGNVNTSSGSICWGGNSMRDYKEPRSLEKAIGLFFDAPMNTDLYQKSLSVKKECTLEELLTKMSKKKAFDEKLLQETSRKVGNLL